MSRVKGGVHALKTRRNILKQVKGFRNARSTKERQAHEAIAHAGTYSFAHRRDKKNDMRRLWQVRIGAALKALDWSYSKFIGAQKKAAVELDRKVLSQIAQESPEAFKNIVEFVKK
jgi:large subunit ribosomal protein L20